MRSLTMLVVLAVTGCAGGTVSEPPSPPSERRAPPPWLDGEFADGRITFRYPGRWERSTSEKYGALLSDHSGRHPAFMGIRYLEGRSLPVDGDFAARAARLLRPPDGRGLTTLYTQTALMGGRRGIEATFMWQRESDTPLGPTFRTFGFELPSGRTAFLVFAAERPAYHGGQFGWVRKTIRWTDAPGRAAGAVVERKGRPSRGGYVSPR